VDGTSSASPNGILNSPFETNCLFMPSALWKELGGFEEAFESAGGGLVNLDLFKRACELLDVQLVSLLGEATFHQSHGGVSTNTADYPLAAWQAEYERLRGAPFRVRRRPMLSLGSPPPQAIAAIHREGATGELVRRYVELLKSALLNETALEAEAAFFLARDTVGDGRELDDQVAYDVPASAPEHLAELVADRAEGRFFRADPRSIGFGYTMIGRHRMDEIDACVTTVIDDRVPGDLVECGTWRGGAAILMRGILAARAERGRSVWVVDSFAGLPPPTGEHETFDLSAEHFPQLAVARERVAENFERFGLLDGRVRFLEGWFKETLPDAPIKRIAVLRLDGDLYESTMIPLTALYDRVSPGGYIIVDDYGALPGCRAAIDEFRATRGIDDPIVRVDWTGVHWRKAVRHRGRRA